MQEFKNSSYETYYPDGEAEFDLECRVRIDEEMIVISYDGEDEVVTYRGHSIGPGHYKLQGDGFDGSASLHRVPGADILEGSWLEGSYRGMWRIKLLR